MLLLQYNRYFKQGETYSSISSVLRASSKGDVSDFKCRRHFLFQTSTYLEVDKDILGIATILQL